MISVDGCRFWFDSWEFQTMLTFLFSKDWEFINHHESFKVREQRFQIGEIYFEKLNLYVKFIEHFIHFTVNINRPIQKAIFSVIMIAFALILLFSIQINKTRQWNVRSKENIADVAGNVEEEAEMSIRRRSQLVGLGPSTTWKILHEALGLRAYKI